MRETAHTYGCIALHLRLRLLTDTAALASIAVSVFVKSLFSALKSLVSQLKSLFGMGTI